MDKKEMDAQFVKEMPEKFDKGGTCHWLSKNNSYIGTEALLCAAQNQVIRTIYIKYQLIRPVKAPRADYVEKR